jgi:hypothetical protein
MCQAAFEGDRWFDPALLFSAVGIQPFTLRDYRRNRL